MNKKATNNFVDKFAFLIMNDTMDSSQNRRMARGIHRCPRTSLLIFVIILEGVKNRLKNQTKPVKNCLAFFTARYRGPVRTAIQVMRIKAFTNHSVLYGIKVSSDTTPIKMPKKTELSGKLDNKKPVKLYKTTICSYLCSGTSWYLYDELDFAPFSDQNVLIVTISSYSAYPEVSLPFYEFSIRFFKWAMIVNFRILHRIVNTRILHTIVNLCRNFEIVIIFVNCSKLCIWYRNNRSPSLIKITHSTFINPNLISVSSDRDRKRIHISARIGSEWFARIIQGIISQYSNSSIANFVNSDIVALSLAVLFTSIIAKTCIVLVTFYEFIVSCSFIFGNLEVVISNYDCRILEMFFKNPIFVNSDKVSSYYAKEFFSINIVPMIRINLIHQIRRISHHRFKLDLSQ